jgi:predicted acylesterase/phospholipase RssA
LRVVAPLKSSSALSDHMKMVDDCHREEMHRTRRYPVDMQIGQSSDAEPTSGPKTGNRTFPGQVVLVLQGGGALGSYQAGVYQALHEAGVEPDWIVGTSIGAINASLIAGNAREKRLPRLKEFWKRIERNPIAGFRCPVSRNTGRIGLR